MACVAGFIAGSSLPMQAQHHRGVARWVHEHGGRLAIAFVIGATAFSLSAQAYVIGHTLAGVSHFLRVSPALLLLGVLPHAILELTRCSCRSPPGSSPAAEGEWEQLLAATLVTVAIAVPVLVVAAYIEVYVSPHLFTALTHIHPPIVRNCEGVTVIVALSRTLSRFGAPRPLLGAVRRLRSRESRRNSHASQRRARPPPAPPIIGNTHWKTRRAAAPG